MTKDVLLEIGLEELPAKYVFSSSQQLKERVQNFLNDNRLTFDQVDAYATPRRLAVIVKNVAEQQADSIEELKGPARHIAQKDGEWTKAAQGFVRSQNMQVEDIYWQKIKDVDYAYIKKEHKGQKAFDLLINLKQVILDMTFPISMTWGSEHLHYIRPIHWIIALYGNEIIHFNILNITTNRISQGHRFLGKEAIIDNASEYVTKLKEQYVLVDQDERKNLIKQQITDLAKNENWQVDLDADLLDEVNAIVEYPTAFYGQFAKDYLAIPDDVLITTMKEHQRYFYVRDEQNQLLPYFISVRNGNSEFIENVVKGNEKVLVARLEDALFFTNEDKKLSIAEAVEKLKNVNFHVKIGSMYEKMDRTKQIVAILLNSLAISTDVEEAQAALRASEIYKFDLVTNMVNEFPELQGVIGEYYALEQNESKDVAQAIREHYLPLSTNGELPTSLAGALVALADKIETLCSFFLQNMVPTGSNDPYALRRQAMGVVQIISNQKWSFDLLPLFKTILTIIYEVVEVDVVLNTLKQFMQARIQQKLQQQAIRHDIIEAVLAVDSLNIVTINEHATILQQASENKEQFKQTIEACARVLNLANKANEQADFVRDLQLNVLETNASQAALIEQSTLIQTVTYQDLVQLTPYITDFFKDNMVLVEDSKIRNQRLNLLCNLSDKINVYADLTKLVVK